MMVLYKFINQTTVLRAKNPLYLGNGRVISNPTEDMYRFAGYMDLVESEMPFAPYGKSATPSYTIKDGKIIQIWNIIDDIHD